MAPSWCDAGRHSECPQPPYISLRRYARDVAFERITTDPELMAGLPTIRGLRIPVTTVVAKVADGMSVAEIVRDL